MSELSARIETLRRELAANPASRQFYQLGELLRREGKAPEAIEILRKGLASSPRYVAAWVALGRAQLDVHDGKQAADALREAIGLDPANPVAWRLLGEARKLQGQNEGALSAFERALQLAPGDEALEAAAEAMRVAAAAEVVDEASLFVDVPPETPAAGPSLAPAEGFQPGVTPAAASAPPAPAREVSSPMPFEPPPFEPLAPVPAASPEAVEPQALVRASGAAADELVRSALAAPQAAQVEAAAEAPSQPFFTSAPEPVWDVVEAPTAPAAASAAPPWPSGLGEPFDLGAVAAGAEAAGADVFALPPPAAVAAITAPPVAPESAAGEVFGLAGAIRAEAVESGPFAFGAPPEPLSAAVEAFAAAPAMLEPPAAPAAAIEPARAELAYEPAESAAFAEPEPMRAPAIEPVPAWEPEVTAEAEEGLAPTGDVSAPPPTGLEPWAAPPAAAVEAAPPAAAVPAPPEPPVPSATGFVGPATVTMARLYVQHQELDAAVAVLERLLAAQPDHQEARDLLELVRDMMEPLPASLPPLSLRERKIASLQRWLASLTLAHGRAAG